MYNFVFYFKIFASWRWYTNILPPTGQSYINLIKKNRVESNDTLFPELSPVVNPDDDRHEESLIWRSRPCFYEDSAVTQDVATQREIVALFLFCIM